MESIKLTGAELFEVSLIDSGNKYKETSKLAGKTYSRFLYDGKVFIVNEDNPFVKDYPKEIKSIKLIKTTKPQLDDNGDEVEGKTDPAIAFDSYVSRAQWRSVQEDRVFDAKIEGQIKALEHFDFSKIDEKSLKELEEAV